MFRRSVFIWFLFSYIAVVALPLALTFFGSVAMYGLLREKTIAYTESVVSNARGLLDERILRANQLVQELSTNSNVLRLLFFLDPNSIEGVHAMKEAIRDIQRSSSVVPDLESVYLYARKHDIVLNNTGKFSPELFFESDASLRGLPFGEWYGFLRSLDTTTWVGEGSFSALSRAEGFLGLFSPLPQGTGKDNTLGSFGIVFSRRLVGGAVADITNVAGACFFVIDDRGAVVAAKGQGPADAVSVAKLDSLLERFGASGDGLISTMVGGDLVVVARSNAMPWTYAAVFPAHAVLGDMRALAVALSVAVAATALLGLAVSLMFARANSLKVRGVLALFRRKDRGAVDGNEFDQVVAHAHEAIEEIERIEGTFCCIERVAYPLEAEERLLNALRAGNEADALESFDRLLAANEQLIGADPEVCRCLCFETLGTAQKARRERTVADGGHPFDDFRLLFSVSAPEDMAAAVRGALSRFCASAVPVQSGKAAAIAAAVEAALQARFSEKGLSLALIADQVGLSPAYLSQLYKTVSGRSVAEALLRLRVQRAKDLLKEPTIPIKEIADRTGFSGDAVLIRVFKRFEGVTPGRYREISAADSSDGQ